MRVQLGLALVIIGGLAVPARAQQDSQYPLSIFWFSQQPSNSNQIGPFGTTRPYKFVQFINTNLGSHNYLDTWPDGVSQVSTHVVSPLRYALVPDGLVPATQAGQIQEGSVAVVIQNLGLSRSDVAEHINPDGTFVPRWLGTHDIGSLDENGECPTLWTPTDALLLDETRAYP